MKKLFFLGLQREEQLFLETPECSFSRPSQNIDVVPASTEVMHTVSDSTDDDVQPSTSALLTDISNNLVISTSFHRIRTEGGLSSKENFSPPDEEYIPNTDEDSIDYEFEKRRQINIHESDR